MAKYIISSTRLNEDGTIDAVSHPIEVDSDTIHTIKIFDKTYILEKHGRWVLNERGVYQCECGFVPTMEEKIYYNYCPNCGAKMDESELTTSAELHPEKYLKNLNEVKE